MNAATLDRHGGGILLDSKQMHYILKVVECQNITRAAEQLYVSQPALSSLISKVEEELGAKIFNRNTTPLTLTQEGECYVRTARKILALQQAMTEEIENIRNCREGRSTSACRICGRPCCCRSYCRSSRDCTPIFGCSR